MKWYIETKAKNGKLVAPHAGAWIEMDGINHGRFASTVAPHAGAWIEIRIVL